jgi:hypothetical protein
MHAQPDITGWLRSEEGLPRPNWDLFEAWIDAHCEPSERRAAWTAMTQQWLAELADALGGGYACFESEHFLSLSWQAPESADSLLRFAEHCRESLLGDFADVTRFDVPGKQILLVLRSADDYYQYISAYFAEGEYGGSGGVHIRDGYPHIAMQGQMVGAHHLTLAHEMTHAAFQHLNMPQWLEEGLAQASEQRIAGRAPLFLTGDRAREHKDYWHENGLDEFWHGAGFFKPDEAQALSYQLAEILVQLLIEESRPRWFGLVREPQRRFFEFLKHANRADCGASACSELLGFELADLAAQFLGPGNWSPKV